MTVRILIVEDNRGLALDLQERLLKLGYEVIGTCTSGREAIQSVKALAPDVVIMNICFQKGVDGIKIDDLVRSKQDTPIIYTTEVGGQTIIRQTIATGPSGYIFMPFSNQQIFTTLETALLRNQYEKQIQQGKTWLANILNSITDGVIVIDNEGLIQYINPVAQHLTARSQSEAVGSHIENVLRLIDEEAHKQILFSFDSQGSNKRPYVPAFEALLLTRKNETIPVSVNVTLIAENSFPANSVVIVFRDIRKQREIIHELQRQAERAHMLVKTAEQLNESLDFNSVLSTICKLSNQAINASATGVFLLDARKGIYEEVSLVAAFEQPTVHKKNRSKIPMDVGNSLLSMENQVATLSNVQIKRLFPFLELTSKESIRSIVIAGIFYKRNLIGILLSFFMMEPSAFQQIDLELWKGLVDQAATSITNAKLLGQVLTGRENQRKLAKAIVQAQEEERRHIARELHDHFGQIFTGLQFLLESAKHEKGKIQEALIEEIQDNVNEAIEQIREISLNLRPGMLDDMGLLPTLQWHLERYKAQTGIYVNFQSDHFPERFPPDIETAAYRIIQEALTNVARHANVKEVFVGLIRHKETLWIEILDQGVGFDPSPDKSRSTSGLRGMHERASMVGGYLVLESYIGQGTQIAVALPLNGRPLERRKYGRNNSPLGG